MLEEDGAAIKRAQQLLAKNQIEAKSSSQWVHEDYATSDNGT